jgi:hypothetical protein
MGGDACAPFGGQLRTIVAVHFDDWLVDINGSDLSERAALNFGLGSCWAFGLWFVTRCLWWMINR